MEVLCATTRTGPVLLTREDALLKFLPLLERPDARTFIAAAKLAVSVQSTKLCTNETCVLMTAQGGEERHSNSFGAQAVPELVAFGDQMHTDGTPFLPCCIQNSLYDEK